jgi:hypothetical protein
MGVLPVAKRAGDHHVAEHAPRPALGMLRRPHLRNRSNTHAYFHARSRLIDSAGAFHNSRAFPRWRQTRERVGKRMPGVNSGRGCGHSAAVNERFAHRLMIRCGRGCGWVNEISGGRAWRFRDWSAPWHRTEETVLRRDRLSGKRPKKPGKRSWYIREWPQPERNGPAAMFRR